MARTDIDLPVNRDIQEAAEKWRAAMMAHKVAHALADDARRASVAASDAATIAEREFYDTCTRVAFPTTDQEEN